MAVGFHEYSEMLFIMDLVRAGDYFIDVGANLGVYAVTAATLGAEVLAFEPGVDARRVLSENVELNGVATKVAIQPVALADFDGTARFTSTLAGSNHLMVGSGDDEAADEVEVRSLDGLLESQAGSDRSVTVLKVDAEGFDVEVLEGASKSINRDRPVIMVEQGAAAPALRKALTALGYDALEYLPQSRTMAPVPPTDVSHRNLICVHPTRRDWVEARIRTATRRDLRKPRVRWRTPTTFAQGS